MDQNPQSQLKLLIAQGKEQGYLTYAEVNDSLPEELVDADQIEDIIQMITDMGIQVFEVAPDTDELMLAENIADEDVVEEATKVLSTVESELGRTTDPVRMYMREMGTVELLTREGEIDIAKRIEEGINEVQCAVAEYPEALSGVLACYEQVEEGTMRLADLVTAFIDPNLEAAAEEHLDPDLHHDAEVEGANKIITALDVSVGLSNMLTVVIVGIVIIIVAVGIASSRLAYRKPKDLLSDIN